MSHLVLELRQGEVMVVNGATIRFRNKCRVELVSQARFLFGKQVMAAHEAETDVRQLYYRLQTAYVGDADERVEAADDVRALLNRLKVARSPELGATFMVVEEAFDAEDFYRALKLVRTLVRDENLLKLGADTVP